MNRASEVAAAEMEPPRPPPAFAEWCWVHWHGGEGGGGQLVTIAAPVSGDRAALLQMRVGGFGLVGERHLCSSGSGTCRFVAEIRLSFRTFFRVSCAYEPQAG